MKANRTARKLAVNIIYCAVVVLAAGFMYQNMNGLFTHVSSLDDATKSSDDSRVGKKFYDAVQPVTESSVSSSKLYYKNTDIHPKGHAEIWLSHGLKTMEDPRKKFQYITGRQDFLKQPPFPFDPNFKNPCWQDAGTLRCLPYVYVLGVKQSGTSDLFYRLSMHPDFERSGFKEAQFFARKRFSKEHDSIMDYVRMFQGAADNILKKSTVLPDGSRSNKIQITGEGSPSNFHLNLFWDHLPGNENLTEPKYVIFDYIHHFVPQAKLLIVFRDPVDRLYSDYYHEYGTLLKYPGLGPDHFHKLVEAGLAMYESCFATRTVRSCVYEPELYGITRMQIQLGIYHIFWKDLTRLFPREQILVLHNKEMRDTRTTMKAVYEFLGLRKLNGEELEKIVTKGYAAGPNSSRKKTPMHNATRTTLQDFYSPFNLKMYKVTNDRRFLYNYSQ